MAPNADSLAGLFRERARRCPNAPALVGDRTLSYAELDAAGHHVAQLLRARGVTRGSYVAFCFSRSVEAICGLLGTLKLGAAYVPIAPELPASRRKLIIKDVAARCVLTQTAHAGLFSDPEFPPVVEVAVGERSSEDIDEPVDGDAPAWVLYTSGSTGSPKGVIGTHRGSINRIRWMWDAQPLATGEICFQNTGFGTVDSFWEIWGSLAGGCALRIVPDDVLRDPRALIPELNRFGVRRICLVPSYLTSILDVYPDLGRAAPHLSTWVASGEPLTVETCRRFYEAAPRATLFNQYGLTETCADITCFNTRPWWLSGAAQGARRVPIGRPIDGVELSILSENLQETAYGDEGELFVGGICLARGYVNEAETRSRFIWHRTAAGEDKRLYRTGDRVRWRSDGELEFLGRKDTQVKIRGYRVELDEVEIAVGRLPEVAACAVVASDGPERRLGAFVTLATGPDEAMRDERRLRQQLADVLPTYMLPADIRILDALPLTPTGKIDRHTLRACLPSPPTSAATVEASAPAPQGVLGWLCEEAGRLLGRTALAPNDEFFSAGGDSLLALRLLLRTQRQFGVDISLPTMFEGRTLEALAITIASGVSRRSSPVASEVLTGPAGGVRPRLSFAQERLWVLSKLRPESRAYNLPLAVGLSGPVDPESLRYAIDAVVQRHEVLRSIISDEDGVPVSSPSSSFATALVVNDLTLVPSSVLDDHIDRRLQLETERLFDLSHDTPLRATLFRLGEERWILLLIVHQIVLDDWSVAILATELSELYNARRRGRLPQLPPLAAQYHDVAREERSRLTGIVEDECRRYWTKELHAFPAELLLPTDYARPTVASYRGGTNRLCLAADLTAAIRASARALHVTNFSWLLAAVGALLGRYCSTDDLLVGVPFATRRDSEAEALIGCFFNILPIRLRPQADCRFGDFARQVDASIRAAQAHQELPFEKIVEAAGLRRSSDREPAIRVMVVARLQASMAVAIDGVQATPIDVHNRGCEEDLTLRIDEHGDTIEIECEYAAELFTCDSIHRLLNAAETLIRSAATNVGARLGTLPLVDGDDVRRPSRAICAERAPADVARVTDRVAQIAAETPSRMAIVAPDRTLTYGELDCESSVVAEMLCELGVVPEDRVGIYVGRSAAIVVALLGAMKAGAAYVPLDPDYPENRIRHMLADCGARVLLAEDKRADFGLPVVRITLGCRRPKASTHSRVHPNGLVNVMYTSGSTGSPKGVQVTHNGLSNLLADMQSRLAITSDDVVVASTTITFDIAALELFVPLMTGACVAIAPEGLAGRPVEFGEWIAAVGGTVVQATPSVWQTLVESGWTGPHITALCGGEPLTPTLAHALCRRAPVVWNVYGPTETTIWSTAGHVTSSSRVSIGRAIRNTTVYVLDANLMPLPPGVPGELYIGGAGVARGYWNQPTLTAYRFLPDPFEGVGSRMYATGDRCRQLTDGTIEFVGRIDGQIKVRGFRIEPGEVERIAEEHPAVERAIVTARCVGTPRACIDLHVVTTKARRAAPAFSLFFFASASSRSQRSYQLFCDSARFADRHGFAAVWTPERHFDDVGGPYPNPSVLSAALSRITERVHLRAGSVVLPLHQTIRVAEEWAMVDNLSQGRVGLAIASGWHPQDFAFYPDRFDRRRDVMLEQIDELRRLWRGDELLAIDGRGRQTSVRLFPRPQQAELPLWLTASGSVGTFETAGRLGMNVLTHLLEQDVDQLADKIARYRAAREHAGFDADTGVVTLMLHTFVGERTEDAADVAREPFREYLRGHLSLETLALRPGSIDSGLDADEADIVERAFQRYVRSASLIGDESRCLETVKRVRMIGVDEIACFIDFGISDHAVLAALPRLDDLRRRSEREAAAVDTTAISRHLRRHLPSYMVPATILAYDTLPTTPGGKVDVRALDARLATKIDGNTGDAVDDVVAGSVGRTLADIWTELLGTPIARGSADFFEAGGHSLLAAQLASRIRRAFGVDLPIRTIFDRSRLADLANVVEQRTMQSATASVPVLRAREHHRYSPLSFAQERLAFLDRLFPGTCLYNTSRSIRIAGPLDEDALEFAVATVVGRHDLLRSRLTTVDGVLHWEKVDGAPKLLSRTILSGIPRTARPAALAAAVRREAGEPFNLYEDLPLRLRLLTLTEDEHVLLLTIHHIVSDGWSLGILNRELSEAYNARRQGRAPSLPPLAIQYGDYAAWQRELVETDVLRQQLVFWRECLQGKPDFLHLPSDRSRPAMPTYKGHEHRISVPAEDVRGLKALAQTERVTLFISLMTMLQAFLSRCSGESDITIGTPIVDRGHVDTEPLIGLFLNTIAMRLQLSPDDTIRDALRRNREISLHAYGNKDVPFERVVDELAVRRDVTTHPIFQVMLVLRNVDESVLRLDAVDVEAVDVSTESAKFDLTVWAEERGDTLDLGFEYAADLFDQGHIEAMAEQFATFIAHAVAQPDTLVARVPLLTDRDQMHLLKCSTTVGRTVPRGLVHELVSRRASLCPERIAVRCCESQLTYAELARRSDALARALADRGLRSGARVGVCMTRSCDMVVALLGILKTGAAFVAIDAAYPNPRIAFILEDASIASIVTERSLAARLADCGCNIVTIEDVQPPSAQEHVDIAPVSDSAIAYLVYTSGSTGSPKGVMIQHRSAVAMLTWAASAFTPWLDGTVLASTSISFDLSIFEIFAPLIAGGTVAIVDSLPSLPEREAASNVAFVNTVPSVLEAFLASHRLPDSVRVVCLAGEPLTRRLAEKTYGAGDVSALFNLYGPSECTTYSTIASVTRGESTDPSIGRPISNTSAYVLDENMQLSPVGVAGELYLGGAGVALGYWKRPGLTAERFVPDPFAAEPGSRLYATGDLVRWTWRRELEFLGRRDRQIKVRGFRIEPAEIESAIAEILGGAQVAVVLKSWGPGDDRLVAYVAHNSEGWDQSDVREALRRRLPAHLIPSNFVRVPSLPLTPNGKLDATRLPNIGLHTDFERAANDSIEGIVATIWSDVLRVGTVGATTNFFDAGGHSLLLIAVQARIRDLFGIALPLVDLFTHVTVRTLANYLARCLDNAGRAPAPDDASAARRRAALQRMSLGLSEPLSQGGSRGE